MKAPLIGKRIGFILGTIHTGSSLKVWLNMAEKALKGTGSFFVFPGGKLETESSEKFRNCIYPLVNSKNLDGVISWASSISGDVSTDYLVDFHKKFSDIPFVTIGHKIENNPFVDFDAAPGMKDLVCHFIKEHGSRKIAFLRGPEGHKSGEERYEAFCEVLKEFGLDSEKNNLISDNFAWSDGEKAVRQLVEDRGLVPGKDFDTLIASSDMMAFSAVNWLNSRGVRVPKDILVGGFNDTVESRIMEPTFSTVKMPQEELGHESFRMLSQLLDGESEISDKHLPVYPIIRESCGCGTFKMGPRRHDFHVVENQKQLTDEVYKIFSSSTVFSKSKFEVLFGYLFENKKTDFFATLSQMMTVFFEKNRELSEFFEALNIVRRYEGFTEEFKESLLSSVNAMAAQVQERSFSKRLYERGKINSVVSSLKNDLLSVRDKKELVDCLKKYLPVVGIHSTAIVLHESEDVSRYIGGFNSKGDFSEDEILFESDKLFPEDIAENFNSGVYIVQPLFIEDRALGYIISSYSSYAGHEASVYEDLRSSVSSTLKSISLFEELNAAKKIAEQAEFEKTEFFANVGSDLCDPLKDISAKLLQMENNVNEGLFDADILGEQLIFLRSQVEAQLEKTELLVDLTRSQVDDLPMDKKLFDIRQILPVSVAAGFEEKFPLLFGDVEHLAKSIQSIFDFSYKNVSIEKKNDGAHIYLSSVKFDWQRPELLLAEKMVLLQYGDILKTEKTAEVVLPWPNLAGDPPDSIITGEIELMGISEKSSGSFDLGKEISMFDVELAGKKDGTCRLLYWEPDEAPIDEWIKVYGLRHNERLYKTPLLCYSRNLIGQNFMDILEQKIKTQKTAPVLFVGAKHVHYGTWATDSNSVSIASMDEFDKILTEITPSLIVFEAITEKDIVTIRRNQKTVLVPILVLPDSVLSEEDVDLLCSHPRIILCNRGAAESEQFDARIHSILEGDEILPPHTGALVKKAILYLNKNASQQIVRWKLADTVHVSEDYLTRIFHKEIGLSLWEYLNRYRIYIATKMLLETNDTIYEIAEKSGFQDQAYFCRVFKKIYGLPPGKIRTK